MSKSLSFYSIYMMYIAKLLMLFIIVLPALHLQQRVNYCSILNPQSLDRARPMEVSLPKYQVIHFKKNYTFRTYTMQQNYVNQYINMELNLISGWFAIYSTGCYGYFDAFLVDCSLSILSQYGYLTVSSGYYVLLVLFLVMVLQNMLYQSHKEVLILLLSFISVASIDATSSPTIFPTYNPTRAPTPLCLSLTVTVLDANGSFNDNDFNGLYIIQQTTIHDRPMWKTGVKTIQYFSGSYWIIKGIGDFNILSHQSVTYFPPVNNIIAEWYHSETSIAAFHVLVNCIDSHSPTSSPTVSPSKTPSNDPTKSPTLHPTDLPSFAPSTPPTNSPTQPPTYSPSISPTQPPTAPPTPECPTIYIDVRDANGFFDAGKFNGLYTYSGLLNNKPIWKVPQFPNDKYAYWVGQTWIINGYQTYDILSYQSDSSLLPFNDLTADWSHSSISSRTFHVNINCIDTYAPITSPTTSPTIAPIFSPTYSPSLSPTLLPTNIPTFSPTLLPSNSPT
eukprot:346422_1